MHVSVIVPILSGEGTHISLDCVGSDSQKISTIWRRTKIEDRFLENKK